MKKIFFSLIALFIVFFSETNAHELKLPYSSGEDWLITRGYNTLPTHTGSDAFALDFSLEGCLPVDRPMLAISGGMIVKAHNIDDNGYGKHVVVDHGNGFTTLYGHLNDVWVNYGQDIHQGQIVGLCGNTGNVSGTVCPTHPGTHLHLKYLQNGKPAKPEPMSGLTGFTTGQRPLSDNYTVLKFSDEPNCYLLYRGALWGITDEESLGLLGYSTTACYNQPDWSYVQALPSSHRRNFSLRRQSLMASGTIVRIVDRIGPNTCYGRNQNIPPEKIFLFNGVKFRWMKNEEVMRGLGYRDSDIVAVTQPLFDRFGQGDPITCWEDIYCPVKSFGCMTSISKVKEGEFCVEPDPEIQPIADFIISTESGMAPLTVLFEDTTLGNYESRTWDFGDGKTSTLKNPSNIYHQPGSYDVFLTIRKGGWQSAKKKVIKVLEQDTPTPPAEPDIFIRRVNLCEGEGICPCDANGYDDLVTLDGVMSEPRTVEFTSAFRSREGDNFRVRVDWINPQGLARKSEYPALELTSSYGGYRNYCLTSREVFHPSEFTRDNYVYKTGIYMVYLVAEWGDREKRLFEMRLYVNVQPRPELPPLEPEAGYIFVRATACEGVKAEPEWKKSAVNPKSSYNRGDTVWCLVELKDIFVDFNWKVETHRNGSLMWHYESPWMDVDNQWGWAWHFFETRQENAPEGFYEMKFFINTGTGWKYLGHSVFSVLQSAEQYQYLGSLACLNWQYGPAEDYWNLQPIGRNSQFSANERIYCLAKLKNVYVDHRFRIELWGNGVFWWQHEDSDWRRVDPVWGWEYSSFTSYQESAPSGQYEWRVLLDTGSGYQPLEIVPFNVE